MRKERYEKELLQIYYRYLVIFLVGTFIYIVAPSYFSKKLLYNINLSSIFFLVMFANTVYFLVIKYFPHFLENQRVYIASFFDVFTTFIVLFVVEFLSPFLSFLFIWYIVGYGTRHGLKLGIFTTVCVNVAWILLMVYSPFWIKNSNVAFGWLLTFLIIPPYFLKLLSKLQKQYRILNINFNKKEFEAKHDFLTKLLNRNYFEKELFKSAQKYLDMDKSFVMMFIDLDGFKSINDHFGHDRGDEILKEVARRLNMLKKSQDIIARLGGDEFAIITQYTSYNDIAYRASHIINLLSKPYEHNIHSMSASIGISIFPDDTKSLSSLKKFADLAMYQAKQSGKGKYCFYKDISSAKSA